jgi:hypothetical protein
MDLYFQSPKSSWPDVWLRTGKTLPWPLILGSKLTRKIKASDLYLGGVRFKSRPWFKLSWLRLFMVVIQFVQEKCAIPSFHFLSTFIVHYLPIIRRCMLWFTDGMVKYTTNKIRKLTNIYLPEKCKFHRTSCSLIRLETTSECCMYHAHFVADALGLLLLSWHNERKAKGKI